MTEPAAPAAPTTTHAKMLGWLRDYGLVAFIGGAGLMHFRQPEFFDSVVPDWFPVDKRTTTIVSGVAELTAGALVAIPKTRKVGGWVALAVFVGVFPANISAAIEGGYPDAEPPMNSVAFAWARLPLQLPMIWWAYRVATAQRDVE